MKLKGNMIFWEIEGFKVAPSELVEAGLGDFVPRNDYRSAMAKGLNEYVKADITSTRKQKLPFKDDGDSAFWSVFVKDDAARNVDKELTVTLTKSTGKIGFDINGSSRAARTIAELYKSAQGTIDTRQFRAMLLGEGGVMSTKLHAISMKKGGGVYFIDKRFNKELEWLKGVFAQLPGTKIHTVPVYDDSGTIDAIADGAKQDIFGDIEGLVTEVEAKFKDGSITKRTLESRKADAAKIFERVELHKENLATELKTVVDRLTKVKTALNAVTERVENEMIEPGDFMAALAKL